MSDREYSFSAQAEVVAALCRPECIKAMPRRPRDSEADLMLLQLRAAMGSLRELAVAKTKLEEAAMWTVKHITA